MDESEILHVLVGHGLPTLFLNTLSSFRAVCPESSLLVIDNKSPQQPLLDELRRRDQIDPHMDLVLRTSNESADPKVGALYEAYRLAFDTARDRGSRYVHILQGDMQVMWWDQDLRDKLSETYARHPDCVNIHLSALSKDRTLMGDIVVLAPSGDVTIPAYSMTDTGMFDLERWDAAQMEFLGTEKDLSACAAQRGLKSIVSPWPTDVQVPWPAVVRRGHQVGREVPLRKPFLCRPLDDAAVAAIKDAEYPVSLEDICVPWGWTCLAPMYITDTNNWYYLNYRRQDLRRNGLIGGRPRWVTAGLDHRYEIFTAPHRPAFVRLIFRPLPSLAGELIRRMRARLRRRPPAASAAQRT